MKLINKITKQHGRLASNTSKSLRVIDRNGKTLGVYKTLEDLTSVWMDPKDLKQFYFIGAFGGTHSGNSNNKDIIGELKSIGNYFETKEEAELAIRKLQAWKRLEDKGFEFEYYDYAHRDLRNHIQIKAKTNKYMADAMIYKEDLDLLFGGEE